MTSFLFWNIMKNDLREPIVRAVVERRVDILLLAESAIEDRSICTSLMEATGEEFVALSNKIEKVRIFTRLTSAGWTQRQSDANGRTAIWSANIGQPPGILLAVAHVVSERNGSMSNQAAAARALATEITRVEDESVWHNRTVVVGDLNMNPFDLGVIEADALHAVMTKAIAKKEQRKAQGKDRRFFYNPMWGLFGDRTAGPAGTFYYGSSSTDALFWHMLDQVLLRPSVMSSLRDIEIVESIESTTLLTPSGIPNKQAFSDHLPIAFRLDLE